jgi:hypothetical protein
MFAFTMLWAYTNFSQFLIIWSGNLPDESPWYVHRNYGSWRTLTLTLSMANFFLPFLLLLSTRFKRNSAAAGGWSRSGCCAPAG